MQTQPVPTSQTAASIAPVLRQRRQRLAQHIDFPAVFWSGRSSSRNYAANTFPFRASSNFLYFAGLPVENAAIRLEGNRLELFMDNPTAADLLWHGASLTREQMAEQIGADAAYPLAQLQSVAKGSATIPVQDAATQLQQSQWLDRPIPPSNQLQGLDRKLAEVIVQIRLTHDEGAIEELRKAAAVSVEAHKSGMAATPGAKTEAEVRAAMESIIMQHNMTRAYGSIVTVHGEVLHNEQYHHRLRSGDLLLADVGAEAGSGWASDITRTWPVSGKFSPTQRDIYDVVLAAHDRCIEQAKPGVEYRALHFLACETIAAGLVDLGILRGQPVDLVAQDAHALFFPHGVGHLLGLDVHDMEDLGDLAGYAPGRNRSDRFGLCYLRLDRPLQPGMAVTIEPGFYQVPALLNDSERREKYQDVVNWERLEQFADVRGIRIEDDVLMTETGCEVLTAALPNQSEAIEELVRG
ncbi:MAG TPA: aminopeptidase P family protein [Trichocoleus sp.]|jgi:Xaa-Pro aminopeptidase/Xaa-Pro dipeptidase